MAQHIFHMLYYEREAVLPHIRHWLGENLPENLKENYNEDKAWKEQQTRSVEDLLTEFQCVRAEQIALLPQFGEALWNEVREDGILWGPVSIKWIVSKTLQHTNEHTHDVARMALFWDRYLKLAQDESKLLAMGLHEHMKTSEKEFIWAIGRVPVERLDVEPPAHARLGEWSARRHLFHLLSQDCAATLPLMRSWLGKEQTSDEERNEERVWDQDQARSIDDLLEEFQRLRKEILELIVEASAAPWGEQRETVWGQRSMKWIVSKTYQHTLSHTNAVMALAVFWDNILSQQHQETKTDSSKHDT